MNMKQNKVLALAFAAMGVTAATGAANAAVFGLKLTSVDSYSNNGSAPASLTGTNREGWVYDDVANTITAPGPYVDLYFAVVSPLFSHNIQGMVLSTTGGATSATSYTCTENFFGVVANAGLCGNYNFGPNFINESTASWGPGTAVSRTLGGDDIAIVNPYNANFDPQSIAYYGGLKLIGGVGATLKVGNTTDGGATAVPPGTYADTNANLGAAKSGYVFTFDVTPPVADNGTIQLKDGVPTVIPVGANDIGLADPVTAVVTTGPTKGVINAVSGPGAAAGITITYTATVGQTGADSFVYQVTDNNLFVGSATVTINISPDTDGDGVVDAIDNCRLVSNNATGYVPTPGYSAPNYNGLLKAQFDSDYDGFGNRCDGDVNNSPAQPSNVNTTDYSILRSVINKPYSISKFAWNAELNSDGVINTTDYSIFRTLINKVPGPSGLACATVIPCRAP